MDLLSPSGKFSFAKALKKLPSMGQSSLEHLPLGNPAGQKEVLKSNLDKHIMSPGAHIPKYKEGRPAYLDQGLILGQTINGSWKEPN